MELSILICSLVERKHLFERIYTTLNNQIIMNNLQSRVEILYLIDNREKTTGAKRNELVNKSQGKYIAFVDDDDMVSEDYIIKTINAIQSNPDVCSLEGTIYFAVENPRKFFHSLKYKTWFEKNNMYYRNPNHLNCVKRDIALLVPFKEVNFGEDKDYSMRLLKLLKTESEIKGNIYIYYYSEPLLTRNRQTSKRVRNLTPNSTISPFLRKRINNILINKDNKKND